MNERADAAGRGALPAAVVFDFDGLVLDTEWCEYETAAAVFADHGTELSLELWRTFIGSTDHPHWADILEEELGHAIDRATLVPARHLANWACARTLDVQPGVAELQGRQVKRVGRGDPAREHRAQDADERDQCRHHGGR